MRAISTLDGLRESLQEQLDALVRENKVPGAVVAVAAGNEMVEVATGVLSKATGVEATTDSVFQIGSITKPWTATLIMQLADEGRLDLEAPVREYVPDFRVADESASAKITARQLLCHTAGFEGDIFTDTGRGDDAVEKYLGVITHARQLFPPGQMFSYNNAGYCVLGRIVEVLRGKPFDVVVREKLVAPLVLDHFATSADEAILHRAAVGHIGLTPDGEPQPTPVWSMVRSVGPAGATLTMAARDLVGFACMHLRGGTAPEGTRVLSERGVRAMQERQIEMPPLGGFVGSARGLGWEIFDWPGGIVIGHTGGTSTGQVAFLRLVPEKNVAIAMLTNGINSMPLYPEIFGPTLLELAGITMPPFPEPAGHDELVDCARYVGRYEAEATLIEIDAGDAGRLRVTQTLRGAPAEAVGQQEPHSFELARLEGDTFVSVQPQLGMHLPFHFIWGDRQTHPRFLHIGRALPRIES